MKPSNTMSTSGFQKCRVHINTNVHGTPKPPYANCAIVCDFAEHPPLYEIVVFTGTYEECEEFVKKNCKNCINCEQKH